ncbi:MAG: aldo/keto reductase [Acidimicrobiales bacterium]
MNIPTLPFGRTGHESTRLIFGAVALSSVSQAEADKAFDQLVAAGINHIDVAASYGDAELRVAPWLKRAPGHFFLATKTDERRADGARQDLERSLSRLGVDHIDLWQMHNLVDPIEWDVALSPGGVLEAAIAARQEGLTRYIGITGHGAQVAATHRRSLERFDFDSVLLPYNYLMTKNRYYDENFEALLATCAERDVAVQTIKSLGAAPWWGRPHTYTTWYEPLSEQPDIDRAIWWALGRPGIFVISTGDLDILPRVLDAARRFSLRPSDEQMDELVSRRSLQPLFV